MSSFLQNQRLNADSSIVSPHKKQFSERYLFQKIKPLLRQRGYDISQFNYKNGPQILVSVITKLQHFQEFQIVITSNLSINFRIQTVARIFRNGIEFVLKDKHKISIVKQFLNCFSPYVTEGSINLQPCTYTLSGSIQYQNLNSLKRLKQDKLLNQVIKQIQTLGFDMKIVFYKILYIIEEVNEVFLSKLNYECNLLININQLNQQLESILKNLLWVKRQGRTLPVPIRNQQQIIQLSNKDTKPKKVSRDGSAAIMDPDVKNNVPSTKSTTYSTKEYSKSSASTACSSTSTNFSTNSSSNYEEISSSSYEIFSYYQDCLRQYPYPRMPNENISIYSEIVFHKVNDKDCVQWSPIFQSRNVQLSKGLAKFRFAQKSQNDIVTKYLLRKQFVGQNAYQNYQKQSKILQYLKTRTSVYLTKFYHVDNDDKYRYSILMDLYAQSSADIYLKDNHKLISVKTKLILMYPIAQGIRFLRDSNIVHMDLKFQNVLIARGLTAKITDFGQSVILGQYRYGNVNSGYTLPYVAYQHFLKDGKKLDQIRPQRDTYSYGVMLDQIFMNRLLFPFRRNLEQNKTKLIMHLKQESYPSVVSFVPQKYLLIFPYRAASLIWTTVLLCIHPDANQRINMDIVAITLKKIQKYFQGLVE